MIAAQNDELEGLGSRCANLVSNYFDAQAEAVGAL
jgi:hypothetical protein